MVTELKTTIKNISEEKRKARCQNNIQKIQYAEEKAEKI